MKIKFAIPFEVHDEVILWLTERVGKKRAIEIIRKALFRYGREIDFRTFAFLHSPSSSCPDIEIVHVNDRPEVEKEGYEVYEGSIL